MKVVHGITKIIYTPVTTMAVFWAAAPCTLVLIMEAVRNSKTS
jgi:hypothetical protein